MFQDQGSLERAVKGDYSFRVGEILSEAWERVNGAKLKIIAAMFIYVVIASIATAVVTFFLDPQPYYDAGETFRGLMTDLVVGWLVSPITVPLSLGLLLLGYSRANDEELRIESIFDYYILVWPLVFASIFIALLTYIGLMLLILPGIYLSIAYSFTLPLMADKGLGIWGAMEVSRQAVSKHWFTVFGVNVSLILLVVLSAIPLGIGLIWTVPLVMIAQGVMYRKIFGWKIHDPVNP